LSDNTLEYVKCEICGKDDSKLLFKAKDHEYGLPGEYNIVKCCNCGLIYVNPRPRARGKTESYYPDSAAHIISSPFKKEGFFIKAWRIYTKILFGFSIPLNKPGRYKVLDVGCGSGEFLKSLEIMGYETYGVDISHSAVEKAKKLGLNVFFGELHEAEFQDNHFD